MTVRVPLGNKIRRTVRWARRRFTSCGLILMYHRVMEKDADPWSLSVTPGHFAEHLDVLKRHAVPMRLDQLAQAHLDRNIPDRAAVVTFDDGYANNLYNAKPLLERFDIPATVFVSTGYLGRNREFWWDDLDRILLKPGRLPERLQMSLPGGDYRWELEEASDYSAEEYRRECGTPVSGSQTSPRVSFYHAVWERLHGMPEDERDKAMDLIMDWAGVEPDPRQSHRPLSAEEVRKLEQGGLLEAGAHTVHHLSLPTHSVRVQRDEIGRSKTVLEEVVGHPITVFSYPFGEYRKETVALVNGAGFSCACTTVGEPVWSRVDRYELPRFDVRDWSGEEFEERLLKWFAG